MRDIETPDLDFDLERRGLVASWAPLGEITFADNEKETVYWEVDQGVVPILLRPLFRFPSSSSLSFSSAVCGLAGDEWLHLRPRRLRAARDALRLSRPLGPLDQRHRHPLHLGLPRPPPSPKLCSYLGGVALFVPFLSDSHPDRISSVAPAFDRDRTLPFCLDVINAIPDSSMKGLPCSPRLSSVLVC